MIPVLMEALHSAKTSPQAIDAIAVTRGPGLLGSLLVGTVTARTLASVWQKPLVGVHHTLGHLSSTWLQNEELQSPQFPMLSLSVSGGHTELWYRTGHTKGVLLGSTRDDAAGEAFDKGASLLGLGYPGGPAIAKAARGSDPDACKFPLPLHNEDSLDFSFSGLKTALKYLLRDMNSPLTTDHLPLISASYQHAICLHLLDRLKKAVERYPDIHEVHLVGGVSANEHLRSLVQQSFPDLLIRFPSSLTYCTDNAAMIAAAGYFMIQEMGQGAYRPFETEASLPLTRELSIAKSLQ